MHSSALVAFLVVVVFAITFWSADAQWFGRWSRYRRLSRGLRRWSRFRWLSRGLRRRRPAHMRLPDVRLYRNARLLRNELHADWPNLLRL
ncbi:unnamed protein product [Sphagnum balticum]